MLDIVANYHCMQFQGKHMIQTHANGEKFDFGPNLDPLDPNSNRQLFFKNLAAPVTKYQGQVSACKISEKTNDPILRKFSDGRTDGQSDFISCCLTDVKCPTY